MDSFSFILKSFLTEDSFCLLNATRKFVLCILLNLFVSLDFDGKTDTLNFVFL